jgi:hypothetical protein
LGLQGVQWAVGLVVVRASWPGHPRKSKKKLNQLNKKLSIQKYIIDQIKKSILINNHILL